MKMNLVSTAQRLQAGWEIRDGKTLFWMSKWENSGEKKMSPEKSHLEMLLQRLNPRLGG